MGAVVVADQVDVEVVGDLRVDLGQELLELHGAVAAVQAGDHRPVGGVLPALALRGLLDPVADQMLIRRAAPAVRQAEALGTVGAPSLRTSS